MTNEETIFVEALGKGSAAEQAAYLDQACAGDLRLRQDVDLLLAAHGRAGGILEAPPAAFDAITQSQPPSDGVGSNVGPYKLLEQIGGGGMGVVYMAEQLQPVRRKVALKIIKPGMDSGQVIARFEAERQALTMMDHPHIAKVLDAGTTQSCRPYFVMELVKGIPITDYCDRAQLTTRQRLELFIQVCHAVQHAHQKGIIHRDIKPGNVLVTLHDNKAVPKVIDFGIAKATGQQLTDKTLFTNFAQMMGTPLYMSPEQAQLSGIDVDTRSDVYSLGVLLYELLTGTTPIDKRRLGEAAYDEMRRIIRDEEPPKPSTRLSTLADSLTAISAHRDTDPRRLGQLVRGDLDWIVMKALEKDRARRYETANGLARDVERHLHDEPVQACPPSTSYRFRKFARRNKHGLAVAALLAMALLLGSVISTWQAMRARSAEGLSELRFESEKEARGRAVTEASKANAISNLLQEALGSANPDQLKGADYTVRNLLGDISNRLVDQLDDQPEAKAAIHATIGNAYRRLGLPQEAEPHLLKALELRQRILGPEHLDVAQSLLDHSYNTFESQDRSAAEAEVRKALAIFQKGKGRDESTLGAFALLILVLQQEGKTSEAQAMADQAFVFAKAAGFTERRELAMILHNLVQIRIAQGDFGGAEELAVKAVAMHRRVNGNDHPETGWALLHLGLAFEAQRKLPEAESSLREALALFRRQYPESNKSIVQVSRTLQGVLAAKGDTAGLAAMKADNATRAMKTMTRDTDSMNGRIQLAHIFRDAGDLDGALTNLTSAVEFATVATPELKQSLADEFSQLAKLLNGKQKREQAERAYLQAIALRDPFPSTASIPLWQAQANDYNDLAFVLFPLNRLPEAEIAVRKGLELKLGAVSAFPESRDCRTYLVHSYMGLKIVLDALGRPSEALVALEEGTKTLDAPEEWKPGPEYSQAFLGQTLWQIGDAWLQRNRTDKAEQAHGRALKVFADLATGTSAPGHFSRELGVTHSKLANVAVAADRLDDAERHLRASLDCYRKVNAEVPNSPADKQEVAATARMLADVLFSAAKYDQAEPLVLAEYEALPARPSALQAVQWREGVLRIVTLYRDWGKDKSADQWHAKALEAVNQALALAKDDVELLVLRGHFLSDVVESQQQAIAQYSEALAIAPQLSHAWSGRAQTYMRLEQWEMASKDFSKAIELSPRLYVNWLYRGRSYVKLARWDVAIVDYGKVIELVPKAAETYNDLAWLLAVCPDAGFRDPRRAVKLAGHAVELSPKEGGFWNTLGTARYRAGDWANAVTAVQKSMELRAGGDSFDWFVLAMAHWQLNQKDAARKGYDRAVEWMEKNNPDDEELRRFSAEAGELLGVKGK